MKALKTRKKKGGIVAIVLGAMVLIAALIAIQTTLVLSLGSVSRACDDFRQTTADDRRFENVVRESVLALRGASYGRSTASLTTEIDARLNAINTGLSVSDPRLAVQIATPTNIPDLGMYPDPIFPNLAAAPGDLQNIAQPELMRLAGGNVAVSPSFAVDFQRGHVVAGTANTWGTKITSRLVQAPFTRFPLVSYIFPRDVAVPNFAPNPLPTGSPLPGGLVPSLDTAYVGDLRSNGVLPIAFRQRSVMATAYQYLFSDGYFQRVISSAGVTHVADLDVGAPLYPALTGSSVPVLNPDLAGVAEPVMGQEFTIDVGQVGQGTRLITATTYTESKNVLVLFTRAIFPAKLVHLTDSGASSAPLLLILAGGSDGASAQLNVSIDDNISRPICIVGYNIRIGVSGTDRTVNGAVLLDPRSTVDSSAGLMHVAHASYYAYSAWVSPSSFVVDQAMPAAAENLAPRITYVATGASRL